MIEFVERMVNGRKQHIYARFFYYIWQAMIFCPEGSLASNIRWSILLSESTG